MKSVNASLVRSCAAVLIVVASVLPAAAQADLTKVQIDNFGRIDSVFYRGAQPKAGDYADLSSIGIRTLIDLTGDDGDAAEKSLAEKAGLKYVHIPMTTYDSPTTTEIAQFLAVVDDPASQPVYVHCVGGRHRTGVMTAIYRMTHDGWDAPRAFTEMKQYKFGADFLHPEFKSFVYAYHPAPATAVAAADAGAAAKTK